MFGLAMKEVGGALLFVLLGLVLAGGGAFMHTSERDAMESSEAAEAVVVSSSVGGERNHKTSKADSVYYPAITYRYKYDGRTYESSKVMPGSGQVRGKESWARDIVADHPEGTAAVAYVNPEAPGEAYLVEESLWIMHVLLMGVGGALVLGGLVNGLRSIFG
jgi:hypothetical protein